MLRTQGLEVEAPLAFAALHRLLLPVMRLREGLPVPQARALRCRVRRRGRAVGRAFPGRGRDAVDADRGRRGEHRAVRRRGRPLARPRHRRRAAVLRAPARALTACSLVFSARDGAATPFRPDGIAELRAVRARLRLLLAQLLDQRLGDATGAGGHRTAIAESGGNPLALLELPTELSPDQLGGSSPLPAQLHLTTRVEQAFLDRSRLLSAAGAVGAAAGGRRRHRRARRRSPCRIDARCRRAGAGGRRGLRTPRRRRRTR